MPVTAEDSALAERVVQKSKDEANVDTGRLKRSINKKIQRGVIVFREYYYGEYGDNSTLEENAKKMMGDIPYKIERLDESGDIVEGVNRATSGRVLRYERQKKREKKQEQDIRALLIKRREENAKKENSDEDN
jgi:hypothetical protein